MSVNDLILFLFMVNIPLYIYIYATSSLSYVDGYLGCFPVLVIVNSAEVSTGVLVMFLNDGFSGKKITSTPVLTPALFTIAIYQAIPLLGPTVLFSIVAAPAYVPTNSA